MKSIGKLSVLGMVLIIALMEGNVPTFAEEGHETHGEKKASRQEEVKSGEKKEVKHAHQGMTGRYGVSPLSREASGTSWQPDSTPHEGWMFDRQPWMWMAHGFVDLTYDHQGGPRGGEAGFSSNMFMGMGWGPLGPGVLGVRAMASLEPATVGREGYPLLLQTGETADGLTPMIDRQHAHDLFMELSTSYSLPWSSEGSVFGYLGWPGEPALGPPVFMHRFSGAIFPDAPISHHWLDATHISYGVATLGWIWTAVKLEGSLFNGREPDQNRWNLESPKWDSYSVRATVNPSPAWSIQTSGGRLISPELTEPLVNMDRVTASVMHHAAWENMQWATTVAWGCNLKRPGPILDAWLLESLVTMERIHEVFTRVERVEKDELFEMSHPLAGQTFAVAKASLGFAHLFLSEPPAALRLGFLGSLIMLPNELKPYYGVTPLAFMVFVRVSAL